MIHIKNDKGFSAIKSIILITILGVLIITGSYVYGKNHKSTITKSSNLLVNSSLKPPTIPTTGSYLGAYVDPGTPSGQKGTTSEITALPAFNKSIGAQLNLVTLYASWHATAPITEISTISTSGGVPMISWGCNDTDMNVAAGKDDPYITSYAQTLKSYGKPVFLRWFWEMNFLASQSGSDTQGRANKCINSGGSAGYVSAWQHIWSIFHSVGATNVAFVWCPGLGGKGSLTSFYPGDKYVDWIAIDGYDRQHQGNTAFSTVFSPFYKEFTSHNKPIMIGETGATTDQVAFLQGMQTSLPNNFPNIKAVDYFDAVGPAGNWTLQGAGLTQFSQMVQSSYFKP